MGVAETCSFHGSWPDRALVLGQGPGCRGLEAVLGEISWTERPRGKAACVHVLILTLIGRAASEQLLCFLLPQFPPL